MGISTREQDRIFPGPAGGLIKYWGRAVRMPRRKHYEYDQSVEAATRAGNAEQGRCTFDPLAIRPYLLCG
jgi:hypothetical protein